MRTMRELFNEATSPSSKKMKKQSSSTLPGSEFAQHFSKDGTPLIASLACSFFCGTALAVTAFALDFGVLAAVIAYSLGGSIALIGTAVCLSRQ